MKKLNEYIMYYLSGYIVKKLNINCYTCALSLKKPDNEHNYANIETFAKFLDFSNNGGLIRPSIDGYSELSVKQLDLKVISRVKHNLALDSSIFPNLECDNVGILDMPHKISLIIAISSRFIKIRLHSYSVLFRRDLKTYTKKTSINETNIIL